MSWRGGGLQWPAPARGAWRRSGGRRCRRGDRGRAGAARAQTAAAAGPIRLLVLGDSLTAGYGLPAGQGFVPRLEAALRARGRECGCWTRAFPGTPRRAGSPGSTGRWPSVRRPFSWSSAAMTGSAACRRGKAAPTFPPSSTGWPRGRYRRCSRGWSRRPISAPSTAANSSSPSPTSRANGRGWSSIRSSSTGSRPSRR